MMGVLLLVVCVTNPKGIIEKNACIPRICTLLLLISMLAGNILCLYKLCNVNELSQRLYYIKVLQDQSLQKRLRQDMDGYMTSLNITLIT